MRNETTVAKHKPRNAKFSRFICRCAPTWYSGVVLRVVLRRGTNNFRSQTTCSMIVQISINDNGSEFISKPFETLRKYNNISHDFANVDDQKRGMVDRFVRILRELINSYNK